MWIGDDGEKFRRQSDWITCFILGLERFASGLIDSGAKCVTLVVALFRCKSYVVWKKWPASVERDIIERCVQPICLGRFKAFGLSELGSRMEDYPLDEGMQHFADVGMQGLGTWASVIFTQMIRAFTISRDLKKKYGRPHQLRSNQNAFHDEKKARDEPN